MVARSRATVLSSSKFNANPLTCTRNSHVIARWRLNSSEVFFRRNLLI
nr:unnamed protein product [Callosobruchus analis]